MTTYYVDSNASTIWAATTAYSLAAMVRPTYNRTAAQRGYVYEVTTAGTTAGSEPTWPTTSGGTVTDGTVVFTVRDGVSTGGWSKAVGSLAHILSRQGTFSPLAIGDKIFVSSAHSENATSSLTWGANATDNLSLEIVSVNTSGNGYLRGATFSSSNGISVTTRPSGLFRGIDFTIGAGNSSTCSFQIGAAASQQWHRFDDCTFYLNNTATSATLNTSSVSPVYVEFSNCVFRFGATAQNINLSTSFDNVFRDCSLHASSSAVTTLINLGSLGVLRCYGCDWSGAASTAKIVESTLLGYSDAYLDDCKLPASWAYPSGTTGWVRLVTRGCTTRYASTVREFGFTLTTDTLTHRNTNDSGTYYSWKIVTGSGSTVTFLGFTEWRSVEISATGSKTITVDTLIDAAAGLNDNEVWIEVDYQGTSSQVYATQATDWSNAGAAQTSGTASEWTKGSAVTGWIAQRLAVTVTVNVTGYLRYRVFVNKPSVTFYVDPKATVS